MTSLIGSDLEVKSCGIQGAQSNLDGAIEDLYSLGEVFLLIFTGIDVKKHAARPHLTYQMIVLGMLTLLCALLLRLQRLDLESTISSSRLILSSKLEQHIMSRYLQRLSKSSSFSIIVNAMVFFAL